MKWCILLHFIRLISLSISDKISINIGALFDENNYEMEVAFQSAVHRENMYNKNIELVPIVEHVSSTDSFLIEKKACSMLGEGVAGIFGPSHKYSAGIVASICNNFQIPHFVGHWEPEVEMPAAENVHMFTKNFFPESNLYSRALAEIIVNFGWKSFTILYDNNDALMRLQDVFQIHSPSDSPITVRYLGAGPDFRPLLKEIQASGETRIILDCHIDNVLEIFRQGKDVKLMEDYQNYLVTTLDSHTIDYAEIKFADANITAVRLMDANSFEVTTAIHDWNQSEARKNGTALFAADTIKTEAAMIQDAVRVFATVLKEMHAVTEIQTQAVRCQGNSAGWEQGTEVMTAFDQKTEHGMTGRIIFNDKGQRMQFYLEVLELSKEGYKKIAIWDTELGVQPTRDISEVYSQISQSLHNKTIIVSSRVGMPFLGLREPEEGEVLEGNARYEGYSVDLIDGISKILGFQYRFELTPDNKYGSYNKVTKKWDGLVKQLLDRKADIAICDLTITYERRTAVDFTMPFMTLGISILFAKPIKSPPELFSFLSPLSLDVWLYMGTVYLGISLLLFILARAAPDDWESSHPCDQDPEEVENIWELVNCFWLTVGSIMGQGCDLLPKAISTRLVAGLWWFFALIMLASYTANLAAFLTKEQMDVSIEGVEDLAKQSKIKYGALLGGSTLSFFKGSNFSLYQRMWSAMESAEPSVFVQSNKEGEERVAKSKRLYAYFMESLSLEYIIERNCNLTQIGGLLDSKGYGIAMAVNSPYRTHISQAVLKMQEEGKLYRLKNKWWKELNGGGSCSADVATDSGGAAELGIGNVGGVFVVLVLGCFCAFILGAIEFLWNIKAIAIDEKISLWDAFRREIIFALDIRISTKPVHASQGSSVGSGGSSSSGKGSLRSLATRSMTSHKGKKMSVYTLNSNHTSHEHKLNKI